MIKGRTEVTPLAMITGGSKGLGFSLASFLAAKGVDLIITTRGARHLREAKEL